MGESLWHDLDAWQVSTINTAMGPSSAYPTLKLVQVKSALVYDLQEWMAWPKPSVAVISYAALRGGGPQGSGDAELTKTYPTIWMALAQGTQDNAIRDVKILLKRLETLLLSLYGNLNLAPDNSGERLVNFTIGGSELSPQPTLNSGTGQWTVVGGIAVRWETET